MKIRIRPSQMLSGLFRRFAPSAVVCVLLTIYGILSSRSSFLDFDQSDVILSMLTLSLVSATAASCLCERYGWKRFIAWIAAAGGAVAGFLLSRTADPYPYMAGICLSLLMLCLHSVSRKDAPAVRLSQVCGWFFVALGVSLVCFLALQGCISAVFALLLQDVASSVRDTISVSIAYISFLLFAPWLFLGGLPDEDAPTEKRAGFRKFTGVVLLPLYLLLIGILLLYVLKIAFTWTMPVGVMNSYSIAALTFFLFFRLTLTGEENRISSWFYKWGALLLLPVIAVQAIGVWMRVSAYGLTEMRVLGLIWTALCIAAVGSALFRKNAFWFFPVAAGVALILSCTPISAQNIAVMNQESRLSDALTRSGMLENGAITANPDAAAEDREIIYSSIDYLEDASSRAGVMGDMYRQAESVSGSEPYSLSDGMLAQLLGFDRPEQENWYYHRYTFTGSARADRLDTRGYAYAELLTVEQWGDEFYYKADKDSSPSVSCRGTTDLIALTACLAPYREGGGPVEIDVPVTFRIGDEEIDLSPLLTGAVLDEEGAAMTQDTLTLASGQKLHFIEISVSDYSSEESRDCIAFTAWLLTPEES